MERLSAREISQMTGGKILAGGENTFALDVAIDSRESTPNSMFVALRGEQTDGHRFIKNAYDNGARVFLISDEEMSYEYGKDVFDAADATVIKVEDTLAAFQEFSSRYLRSLGMRCIAVTGSVGKTTTRDMLYAAISSKYKVGTNKKNYNSETGLPLTLLSFQKGMEVGVLEMGMDAPGQIAKLAEIAEPNAAVITNIGISHIEKLGSREGILKAKMEVTSEFDSKSTLIINAEDDMLSKVALEPKNYNLMRVGIVNSKAEADEKGYDYSIKNIRDLGIDGIEFSICKKENGQGESKESMNVKLPIPGGHNAINCGLAIAGAAVMGVGMKDAVSGIKKMKMTGSRLRVLTIAPKNIRIIDDAYNAAPASVKSALATLSNTVANRRIAILGGINELGELSEEQHREIGRFVGECNLDILITIGEMASWIGEEAQKKAPEIKFMHFEKKECVYQLIKEIFRPGDVVLLKGSRSFELDRLAEEMLKVLEETN